LIEDDPEPGTHLETRITTLEDLRNPDEKMFEVQKPTPAFEKINRVRVSDDFIRKAAPGSTEIAWPTVGEGLLTGGCAVYVSADRTGQIREAWPAGCDNAALETPLRQAMLKWKLKPAVSSGSPVQVESLMGFTFHTQLESGRALPLLTDPEVRKLATQTVEPKFPKGSGPSGSEFIVQISVDETGKFTGVSNTHRLSDSVFGAIGAALLQWKFQPYLKDGKPQYFHADVSFHLE